MISEMKDGVLFYTTVPRRPFEIERTGGTEVIVRHGRERRIEISRPCPGQKGARGQFCLRRASHSLHRTRLHGCLLPGTTHRLSSTTHPFLHSFATPLCSLYFISTCNGKVMLHTRCLTSTLPYPAQVCSIHGHSLPPSLSRRPYMRSVATHTLSRTTQVTPHF